ncbi:hypothetical protein FDO65_09245 [Nakamurella flava]|uniref:Secreted protein n=1 Tax=Nakamurella flava TaxID=2576308 RepID=A0A4V6CSI8_9ACTN|nr:hypothetical protein [Nakamurella flava]TKV61715.1 hypothetical protein FDO65_09245 [Nakamurella flava]
MRSASKRYRRHAVRQWPTALLLAVTALAIGRPPAAAAGVERVYPVHTGIVATTFWVGEVFDATAADGSQVCSSYDDRWAERWSGRSGTAIAAPGTDCAGAPIGGCDGRPSGAGPAFRCATERRSAANGWFPTSTLVTPQENPFYLDLPFDDVHDNWAFAHRAQVVPWAADPGYADRQSDRGFSYLKNRWVRINYQGRTCFGQIQDAGPGEYHDSAYVFGAGDARPENSRYGGAGMDVSPALTGCLGFMDLDGVTGGLRWRFVENTDVPAGPWTRTVTTSQVDGAPPSAAYRSSILPRT